jgi:hypothetical protein
MKKSILGSRFVLSEFSLLCLGSSLQTWSVRFSLLWFHFPATNSYSCCQFRCSSYLGEVAGVPPFPARLSCPRMVGLFLWTLFVGWFGDFPSYRASARNSVSASPDSSRFHLLVSGAPGRFFPPRFSFVAGLRLGHPDFLPLEVFCGSSHRQCFMRQTLIFCLFRSPWPQEHASSVLIWSPAPTAPGADFLDRDCRCCHLFALASMCPVFENLAGTKNSEASESVTFYKIQKKSTKFGKIRPKCIWRAKGTGIF